MTLCNSRLFRGIAAAIFCCMSAPVWAALGENLSVDLRALAMGNAVAADPPGVNAIHYNPAGLAHIQGLQTDIQLLAADFNIRNQFNAPQGYNVFGYSDDPIVCDEPVFNPDPLCQNFKPYAVSKIDGIALYVPFIQDLVKLPEGLPAAVPLGGIAYKPPGSKFTYGTAVFAPMIAGFYRSDDDPGSYLGKQLAIERLTYLSPTIAYEIDDNLSVGAGVHLSYSAIGLESDLRLPNQLVGVLRMFDEELCSSLNQDTDDIVTDLLLFGLCNADEALGPFKKAASLKITAENSASPSYNLGLLWEPSDDFAFGLTYRSKSKVDLKGKFIIKNSPAIRSQIAGLNSSTTGAILGALLGFPVSIPEADVGLLAMNITFPQSIQAGIKYKLFPNLQFNADVHWTDWAEWGRITMKFDRPVGALQVARILSPDFTGTSLSLPMGFQSRWNFAFGMEYSMTDRLRFRLGYEPRKSSIPNDRRNTLVPINNAQLFGAGIGYSFDPQTDIDLTIAHIRSRDNIPAGTSKLSNSTDISDLLSPYAGLDVRTHTKINILGLVYRTRW